MARPTAPICGATAAGNSAVSSGKVTLKSDSRARMLVSATACMDTWALQARAQGANDTSRGQLAPAFATAHGAVIKLARQPAVSTAAMALANGLNVNILRRRPGELLDI